MKATELLRKDHAKVRTLFEEFESSGKEPPETAARIFEECSRELAAHSAIEEEIFYPELSDYEETREIVAESIEEHHVVDVLIDEMRGLEPGDEAFIAKFEMLRENVLHHADEEEQELFPQAERLLGKDRLAWVGERLAERKQQVLGEARSAAGGQRRRKRA